MLIDLSLRMFITGLTLVSSRVTNVQMDKRHQTINQEQTHVIASMPTHNILQNNTRIDPRTNTYINFQTDTPDANPAPEGGICGQGILLTDDDIIYNNYECPRRLEGYLHAEITLFKNMVFIKCTEDALRTGAYDEIYKLLLN